MRKPIDPNLNNTANEHIAPEEESALQIIDADTKEPVEPVKQEKTNFEMAESGASDNEAGYHAHEHGSSHHHSSSGSGSHHHSSSGSSSHHHSSSGSGSHHHSSSGSSSHHHSSSGSSSHHHSSSGSSSHHHSSSKSSHHHSSDKKKHRFPLAVRILIIIFIVLFALVAVAGAAVFALRQKGKKDLIIDKPETPYEETIQYNGHTYVYDSNKIAFAFMGVDKKKLTVDDSNIGQSGQADADIVGTIDIQTGEINIITIPRDTMVDIDIYSKNGKFVGTETRQLCLAYAYGDGGESSCTNVTNSMSRVLKNVPIEKYFALDLAGIAPLNDAIGGVTVESLYDFPQFKIYKGQTVTIKGDFAETYVRLRSMDNIEASLNRTQRQTQYIQAYTEKLRSEVSTDFSLISSLYNTAMSYSQTNISLSDVTYLATVVLSHGVSGYNQYTIGGEMKPSSTVDEDIFAEYYVDDDSVMEAVVNCFYKQVD